MVSCRLGFSVCPVGVPLGALREILFFGPRFWLSGIPFHEISAQCRPWLRWHRPGLSISSGLEGIAHRVCSLLVVGGGRR